MTRVAIVIVTCNSEPEIGGCLDALAGLAQTETVVVDNGSGDATRDRVTERGVPLIANTCNMGFAAAVNQGVRATSAGLVLLLNPDAHLERGLDQLAAQFDNAKTGIVGGMLTGPDGLPQIGFMARNLPGPMTLIFEAAGINALWPRNPINWKYRCLGNDPLVPAPAQQPAGAFLMFSREVWSYVGGFDERFWPIWFEDVDFCARVKAAGWAIYYNPNAVARHTGAHSIAPLPLEIKEQYWYGSLLEYASKHYRSIAYRAVCLAVVSGAALRAIRGCRRFGSKAFVVYGAVCRLACSRLFRFRRVI